MAIRNIVGRDDPILRQVCRPVTDFNAALHTLLDDMTETMFKADGVGLAANQVGSLKRVCIVCDRDDNVFELVNPLIVGTSGEQVFDEGCLSIPGLRQEVTRPQKIEVKAQDRLGKEFFLTAEDFFSVVICHEIDHLNGILFIDRAK